MKSKLPTKLQNFLTSARSSYRLSTSFSLPLPKLLANTVSTNLTTPRPYTRGLTKCMCLKLIYFILHSLLKTYLLWNVLECPPFPSAVHMHYHIVSTRSLHGRHLHSYLLATVGTAFRKRNKRGLLSLRSRLHRGHQKECNETYCGKHPSSPLA